MEIIVDGNANEAFKPDEVIMYINFSIKAKTYEETLKNGNESVQSFINDLLLKNNFKDSDMKTDNFTIIKDQKYNSENKSYEDIGYSYNQRTSLKFDYDNLKIRKIIDDMTHLENQPSYSLEFKLKDINKYRKIMLEKCYNDALIQAKDIASTFNKTLGECIKSDFKFYNNPIMRTMANYEESSTLIPNDIQISAILYCTWIAE